MLKIDKAILDTDKVICKNIDRFDDSERGLLSQNILAQLRNLVEYISQKVYSDGQDIDPNQYAKKKEAWEFIESQGNLNFLSKFHSLLQKSVSHYTIDENGSERLMLKYYEYLLKIKIFLNNNYNLQVLQNIEDFPLNLDTTFSDYYQKISTKISSIPLSPIYLDYKDRYYIQKVKPIFLNQKIYYEITFTIADDKVSKFDRFIAFTHLDILSNYAVKMKIREEYIDLFGEKMPIKIIDDWEVSIRPCELKNFSKIFHPNAISLNAKSKQYAELMQQLKIRRMSLIDIVNFSDHYYLDFKNHVQNMTEDNAFLTVLDKCRSIIKNNMKGKNTLSYLLLHLNNKQIKNQLNYQPCFILSNLYLSFSCIPFEEMPFVTSLVGHNPRIHDLFDCLNTTNREHEFLARLVKNNAENNGVLFTPIDELTNFSDVHALVRTYNSKLYHKHTGRHLIEYKNHIYMRKYVEDCLEIINLIQKYTDEGVNDYTNSVQGWLDSTNYSIDSEEKLNLFKKMFNKSRVALIYGSAGTGKTTLINHISQYWEYDSKLYLAHTNPAINNLKRRVNTNNCDFMTITKFLNSRHNSYDLVFIDECSTVSNQDMKRILKKIDTNCLVLVGDTLQIEAIEFGNWFNIIGNFISKDSVLELKDPYRTADNNLLAIWDRVRAFDMAILEPIVKNNYSVKLDNSILENPSDDEIILCLNYDGIYGINNINRFLQSNNPSNLVTWGINEYKINDPVLFNESERFAPLIHNNMKGKIVNIEKYENEIFFSILLDIKLDEMEAYCHGLEILPNLHNQNSIVRFKVSKHPGSDEDDNYLDVLVPFQVTYAVSIHKAQGLEYNSVKIVITNDVEELITHSIFYTAITRAREHLKIYWTPETEKAVLNGFSKKNFSKDVGLLKSFRK